MTGWTLHEGDARDVVAALPPGSVGAVVTDPPYGLNFMGKAWDTGAVAFDPAFWALVLAAMKPGAHLVAFSGTRTYHRLASAIEAAGFDIRDQLAWVYGTGFPKSHNLGGGRGTALKPAWEPIVLARKPFRGTVAANEAAHGVGALAIDDCRVPGANPNIGRREEMARTGSFGSHGTEADGRFEFRGDRTLAGVARHGELLGRWPANLVHDGSDEVLAAFPVTGATPGSYDTTSVTGNSVYGQGWPKAARRSGHKSPAGSAARFFYCAKATRADRAGSRHPTVKPVALMRWLVRLVAPAGGTVLDPFAGSGTTGAAALAEGRDVVLVERDATYAADIRRRLGGDALEVAGGGRRIYGRFADQSPPDAGGSWNASSPFASDAARGIPKDRAAHRPDRPQAVTPDND